MNFFLNQEIKKAEQAHNHYAVICRQTDYLEQQAKRRARLMMGKPSMLLSIFAVGAFKGATSSNPKKRRHYALIAFARTAFFKFIT